MPNREDQKRNSPQHIIVKQTNSQSNKNHYVSRTNKVLKVATCNNTRYKESKKGPLWGMGTL